MNDRPIIFSAPMILALLAGTKTQTRRTGAAWHALHREWAYRAIDGFPDYLAGRDGMIYSTKGEKKPTPLRGTPSSRGYLTVSLCCSGGIQTKAVHRLIAEAWFGPCPAPKMQVRHLNGEQTDNNIANLDWGTQADNWSDRKADGSGIHEEHHAAKLTMQDAENIRASTLSQRRLAADYGVTQSTVWAIKNGRIWVKAPIASGRNIALPPPLQLWVRENFISRDDPSPRAIYAADHEDHSKWWAGCDWASAWGEGYPRSCQTLTNAGDDCCSHKESVRWRSPIHMPRWASRLTLTVTDVRVQRLQEISEDDVLAEGCPVDPDYHDTSADGSAPHMVKIGIAQWRSPRGWYHVLWDELHGPGAWDANPDVVKITFECAQRNIDT